MEDFKLRSLDEFDSDFVAQWQSQAKAEANAEAVAKAQAQDEIAQSIARARETLIPQMSPGETEPVQEAPVSPVTSLYPTESMADAVYTNDYTEEKGKKKLPGGLLAAKIASIVLLAATVVVFLLGCFVSVFIDNKGLDLGGITFSTLSEDVNIEKDNIHIKAGDMIIAKKADVQQYTQGKRLVMPTKDYSGSVIVVVSYVAQGTNGNEIMASDLNANFGSVEKYDESACLGIVQQYIPKLGSVIKFAIDNSILVCVLFALLAAFWCLALMLIEKSKSKSDNEEDHEVYNMAPQYEDNNSYGDAVYSGTAYQQEQSGETVSLQANPTETENAEEISFDF